MHACAQAFYVVNQAPEEGHHYSLGLIDKEMVRMHICSSSNPCTAHPQRRLMWMTSTLYNKC